MLADWYFESQHIDHMDDWMDNMFPIAYHQHHHDDVNDMSTILWHNVMECTPSLRYDGSSYGAVGGYLNRYVNGTLWFSVLYTRKPHRNTLRSGMHIYIWGKDTLILILAYQSDSDVELICTWSIRAGARVVNVWFIYISSQHTCVI